MFLNTLVRVNSQSTYRLVGAAHTLRSWLSLRYRFSLQSEFVIFSGIEEHNSLSCCDAIVFEADVWPLRGAHVKLIVVSLTLLLILRRYVFGNISPVANTVTLQKLACQDLPTDLQTLQEQHLLVGAPINFEEREMHVVDDSVRMLSLVALQFGARSETFQT